MDKGTVKWYDETKGFGFIQSSEGKDIFVHRTGLESQFSGLTEGQEVSYETKMGPKGEMAFNVK